MNVRKLILAGGIAVGLLAGAAPAAHATTWHLKVDICHNGTVVPVGINATSSVQDVGHGMLDLDSNENVQSFVAHNSNGHAVDTVLRVYWKSGNAEENTWTSPTGCAGGTGPQGDPGPKGDKGDPGDDGRTPTIICYPGQGLGFTFDEFEDSEDAYVLEAESICPLAGADGVDGVDGLNGSNGADGVAGKDADPSIVTELNNRLFILEHTDPAAPDAPAAPEAPATPPVTGELPKTGAGTTLAWTAALLVALGALMFGLRRAVANR